MQWILWNWVGRASEWQKWQHWGNDNQNPRESDLSWLPGTAPKFSCLLPEVSTYCSLDRGRHWGTKISGMWLRLCKHRGGASPTIQTVGTMDSAPANQEHLYVPKHCEVLEHWSTGRHPTAFSECVVIPHCTSQVLPMIFLLENKIKTCLVSDWGMHRVTGWIVY